MNKKNGGLAKSAPYALITIIGYVVSMITLPILTNLFTKNEFGYILTMEAKISLLISLFLIGIPQAYIRFYNKYKNENNLSIFNFNFFSLISIILLISFGFSWFIFSYSNSDNEELIIVLALIVSFSVIMQQVSSVIRAKEKTFIHAMILGINNILIYGLPIISIYLFGLSIENYFISKLVVPLLMFFIILLIIRKDFKIEKFRFPIQKEIIRYGAPLILVSMGGIIFSTGDRIIIDYMLGSESVAIYSVSAKIAHSIFQLLIFPITMVVFPMYIRIWEEKGKKETEKVLSKWLNFYIFIAIAIISGSMVINEEIILILSNESYLSGAILIPILVSGLLIYGAYYFISAGFFVENKTLTLGIIILISSILNLILSFFMGNYLGITGVATATAISYVIFLLISYIIGRKTLRITIDILHIVKFVISGIIMGSILSVIPSIGNIIIDLLLKFVIGVTVYTLLNIKFIKTQIRL